MATVKYAVKDNWGSGFIGNMVVDAGTSGVHGWTVEFDAGFAITNIWGAEIVSRVGTHYVLRNASYNGDIAAGGNVTFGFQATPGATGGTTATGLALNGAGGEPEPVLPTISVADASVVEGNSGTKQMVFTVSLSQAATGPVTVAYATANGTATAGQDYVAKSGTITFAAGETQKTISVTVNGDKVAELNETLSLNLSAPTGATIADGAATGTIATDDVIVPKITIADASVKEGDGGTRNLAFTVTLSEATSGPVTVTYATADGSAKAGEDYVAQSGTITFAAGETSKIINIKVNGDTTIEANETLKINLSAPTGATIADKQAIGTITNDDARISVANTSVTEGNSGTSDLAFTVKLSAATSGPVTVAYTTSNGTAKAGQDYVAQSGVLTFAAGETSKVVHVQVNGDTTVEANETVKLTLSSPTGATIGDGAAVGTIVNDDSTPLPSLSINNVSSAEGSAAAPGHSTFTVTLSEASTTPVTVHFATADGTAIAGSDYVAKSGTLTFAAGETQKTIQIATIGDAVAEANEGFSVVLSSATGATIADATGVGTIVNDDGAPALPSLSISDASVTEGNPGGGAAPGWLSTSGNQIVDSAGHSVQIAGVNWFGFENNDLAPHGLWTRNYKEMMDQMSDLGFNTIRLPFSNDTLHSTGTPNINYSANPDLRGLSALQVMDKIVAYAEEIGLKIILDHHRNDSGAGASDNGLWYDSRHSEADWINDWKMLAERYADNPAVIGADLHNEPFNGTWGGGGPNDWAAAAERAGNAIGEVNPNMLIFVEGVANYQGQSYWWGGNLMGVRDRPIELEIDNKVVYSAHDYPNSVYAQPWFQGANFAQALPAKFDQMWGYIFKENIAPVYIGEFGTKLQDPKDAPWLEAITSYLSGDLDNNGTHDLPAGQKGVSWTFWSWNPNSSDTGGILADDWRTVNQDKMGYLTPIQYEFHEDAPGDGDAPSGPTASFVLTLSEAATHEVTVDYQTVYGEAGAADFVATNGHVTFAAGEQSKTITIEISPDKLVEGNEHFGVVLSNAVGATITRATGTGTIVDDDTAPTTPTTPTNPNPPSGSGDLEAMFAIVNSWSGGFNGSVTLENDGASTVNGWQVRIETTNQITDIWNAVIVSHDASGYVIGNASYNGTIAHDGETNFGFVASGAQNPSNVHVDLLHA